MIHWREAQRQSVAVHEAETRQAVRTSMADWIRTLRPWDWYLTITFRDDLFSTDPVARRNRLLSLRVALNAWGDVCQHLRTWGGEPTYFRVIEWQLPRMVPHFHALMVGCDQASKRMDLKEWLYKRYGIARVLPVAPGACEYLAKYVLPGMERYSDWALETAPQKVIGLRS